MAKKTVKKVVKPASATTIISGIPVREISSDNTRIDRLETRLNRIVAALSTAKRITKDM